MGELLQCPNIIEGKKCKGNYVFDKQKKRYSCEVCHGDMSERLFLFLRLMSIMTEKVSRPKYEIDYAVKSKLKNSNEKKLFKESRLLFAQILDGLKAKGFLRTSFREIDVKNLVKIWDNSRFFGYAFSNKLNNFENFQEIEAAIKSDKEPFIITFGIYSQLVGNCLYYFEGVLKTSLVFILKEYCDKKNGINICKKMTLSRLLTNLKKILPIEGQQLNVLLDVNLRNSIAHGTFWFDGTFVAAA